MKILLPLLAIACLHAQPQHPVVIAGDVAMTSLETANALIYSKSERSIVEWESFSIGKGETLNLSLPSQNGAILNRVVGKEGSQILGKMLSNGKVYLINPQGIVIGSEGMIQAGSFVGSTLDCSNETFLTNAKEWVFSGQGEEITNLGTIQTNFGNIYLIGKRVMNKGMVVAHSGDVSIAAGEKVIIRFEETPLLSIELGQEEAERITNEGTVRAIRSNPYFEAVSGGSQTEKVALIQKDSRIFLASSHITNVGKIEGEQKVHIQGNSLVNTGEILSSEHIQGSLDKMINGGLIEVNNPHQSIQIELVGPYFETASGVIRAPQGQITIQASRIYSSGAHEALQGTIKHLADEIVLPGAKIVAEGGYHQLGQEDSSQVILTSSSILKGMPLDNAALASNVVFVQDELIDPNQGGGNSFGKIVVALPNGNVVVTKPGDDLFGASSGAVYLYNPQTKALLSILTGSQIGDLVGNNGIEVLTNGHFVVKSASWKNGSASGAGAATWVNGWTGITGEVSSSNSLIGSTAGDLVGSFVIPLSNGNYVAGTTRWNDGAITRVGAITWGDGNVGVSGLVSPSNSLVGSQALDQVGAGGVVALINGNYVVGSRLWNNGGITQAGAATWGDGTVGITGPVSPANSLVGSTASDQVGRRITALTNGNYVVSSSTWSDGAISQVGAATWGDGTTMITGGISAANSLIGSTVGDQIGIYEIAALANGNYVVSSPLWDDGAIADVGAVTWGNGVTGTTGAVSSVNSLVGTASGDNVGIHGVQPLTNGNYVVRSSFWDNGGTNQAGAATWGDGTVGISGPVTVSNSLIGSQTNDNVGNGGVIPLTNGNYVVISGAWSNGGTTSVGAATWGDGTTGISGLVSPANSLIGAQAFDYVGSIFVGASIPLTNGNYVVMSSSWDNGAVANAGAATLGNGLTGTVGVVSSTNSLVGSQPNDQVGVSGVYPLSNGNYVVAEYSWNNGSISQAGAATWGNGVSGIVGEVSSTNSLVGTTNFDWVGDGGVKDFGDYYAVISPSWNNGSFFSAGAVSIGDSSTGLIGEVSSLNSLIGQTSNTGLTAASVDYSATYGIVVAGFPSSFTSGRVYIAVLPVATPSVAPLTAISQKALSKGIYRYSGAVGSTFDAWDRFYLYYPLHKPLCYIKDCPSYPLIYIGEK